MREIKFKNYLLGTISELERTAIDRALLTDEDEFEQVLLAEDDLIEAYVRNELSAVERVQFEQFFLADPECQQKLRLARALHRYANDPDKQPVQVKAAAAYVAAESRIGWQRPIWQWALAGSLLVALIGVIAVFRPTDSIQVVQNTSAPDATVKTIPAATLPPGTSKLTVELTPGRTRGKEERDKEIPIAQNHGLIEFKLYLENEPYPDYEVTLIAEDEAPQNLAGTFKPQMSKDGNYVTVSVSVSMLGRGSYRIKLTPIPSSEKVKVETYYFTAKR